MQRLREILCRPVPDTSRSRRYQSLLDEAVEAARQQSGEPGALLAAWCWRSPLSKFHRDEKLLAAAKGGLSHYLDAAQPDGTWKFPGGEAITGFSLGWYVWEPVAAFVWLYETMDDELRQKCLEMFRRGAERFDVETEYHPFSNQSATKVAIMALYGLLLEEPRFLETAWRVWEEGSWMLDENDQVIEQGGPSAHYMYLTIHFLHLYWLFSGDYRLDGKFRRAMEWWRHMHTESMYPLQGMSTRHTYERICHIATWILGALERLAPEQPMFQQLADKILAAIEHEHGHERTRDTNLILALLEHRGDFEPTEDDVERWNAPFDKMYRSPNRTPVCQYLLVKRHYQTAVTFQAYPPMKGLQTWAWGEEPPILQSTYEVPSATRGWGFDTALSNVGRTHPKLGAGLLAEQAIYLPGGLENPGMRARTPGGRETLWYPGCPAYVSSRIGPLWSLHIFTPYATVLIQGGDTGRRVTTWAFHTCCVPEPRVGEGMVTFEGREGRMYFLHGTPTHGGTEEVRTLDFEYEGGVAAFAFSNDSFRFGELQGDEALAFSDASGDYEVHFGSIMFPPGHKHAGTLVWDEWDGFPQVLRK